ncbi:ABC transporter permease [Pyrinomonas methylaliphatogenes]|jgi:NitT/TauT family transport system permease protein|nr:ABC transporter permease subunit [Pyrinomonas methylaliphatogenes]
MLVPEKRGSRLIDLAIFGAVVALIYGVTAAALSWLKPVGEHVEISLAPRALPAYAGYSLLRLAVAYLLSLLFALVYGYVAAYHARAERIMIPLLDVLQSIPVLSFLPGVMLAMVALFPTRQLGVELGSIILIFTGQVWNLAFSFYASLKSIPRELREAATVYRFNRWQRLVELELPYAAIGLIWNSMMSVAGGWFFLMACEMFVLGGRDFRLPGLGAYLQTAADAGDTRAILWGLATMIGTIVLLDQLLWRPLIAWADKFKFEQVESATAPRSAVLDLLRSSRALAQLNRNVLRPVGERVDLFFARRAKARAASSKAERSAVARRVEDLFLALIIALILYGVWRAALTLSTLTAVEAKLLVRSAAATLSRVAAALAIGVLWTVPVGVWIGLRPRVARFAQPLAQIAASIPATALFPVVLLALIRWGGGINIGAVALMLLGTQWYILFNVIAGAVAIPNDLLEVATLFGFGRVERWRLLILPAIFPYLVTGLVTAAGGAWNASIVAEYFRFKGETLMTTGLGATISRATDEGNFDLLLVSTLTMILMVVLINRLVWRRLYKLAATKFKLEG